MLKRIAGVIAILVVGFVAYVLWGLHHQRAQLTVADGQGFGPQLPDPRTGLIPLVHTAKPVGWKAGETPTPAAGLKVVAFATGLDHPRTVLALPNGDVLVTETNAPPKPDDSRGFKGWVEKLVQGRVGAAGPSANRITLLRDTNGDGLADQRSVLLGGLHSPFGMALVGDTLFVADTDAVVKVPFTPGQTKIDATPVKVTDLPAGTINHHWTKGLAASPDGKRLFASVGSNSNVGEHGQAVEQGRAAVWEIDPATGSKRIWAYGIRNPVSLAFRPNSDTLYAVVNERDELGSDIVPDYLTSVQFGGFYGWPWYYWGGIPDSRPKDEDENNLQQYVIRPDYALGPHTASLGLAFSTGATLGSRFANGAFVGQHGSWNRKPFSGYKVIFVPFTEKGPIKGQPIDVLSGFLDDKEQARGRPVGVAADAKGGLLVADDVGNTVWRVTAS